MDQFSLDDARETFAADIGAALAAVAAAARGLGALPPLAAPLAAGAGSGPLGAIADACHAMRGTASLLAVAPVASGAGLIAELAREAAAALARLAGDGARLRAIHAALLAGGDAMREILALELDKRRNASEVALAGFAATARRALAPASAAPAPPAARQEADDESLLVVVTDTERYTSPPAAPAGGAPTAPGEFDFSAPAPAGRAAPPATLLAALPPDGPDAGDEGAGFDFAPVGAPPADFAAELCGIFRQEAAEFLPELRRHLEALATDCGDRRAARELQRIYHTLKGASATAGLPAVSDLARTLEDAVEQVLAGRDGGAAAQVQRLLAHTNDLLKASGLAEIAVVVVDCGEHPSESASSIFYLRNAGDPSAQLLNVFCLESALTLGAVRHTQRGLRQADPGSAAWDAQRQELARLFHLLKGSAVVANQGDVANRAAALQALCRRRAVALDLAARLAEGITGLSTCIDLAMAAAGLGATTPPGTGAVHAKAPVAAVGAPAVPAPAAPPVREQVGAIGDPQLWEALTLEAAELLQGIDRAAVALVDSQRPQRELEELFRAVHTLKGALTTVGVAPLGRYLHRVEDLLAALQDAAILPPLRGIAALAAEVLGTVRANLELIPRGWVEIDHARLESRMHALLAAPGAPVAAGAAPSSLAATAGPRQGSGSSAASAPSGDVAGDQAERRFVRVPAERLDGLMNLTGELVVSRSRIGKRIDGLRHMQRDLLERKDRLLETIGTFRERYEFSRARVQPRPPARPPAGRAAGKAAAGAPAPVPRRAARGGALIANFSDIELDRYEDINILSRSLAEIGDDIAMLHGQFAGACRGIAEDVTAFGGSIGSLQAEITRTRMVAIDVLFARMRLPMHDAAAREAKEVRLEVAGGEVALDKTIVDGLGGALMHLVRNAVSHGVESPARRAAAGKERGGVITLGARQDAGQVVVTVADDGAGLDLAALHRRGVERGLIAAETALDDPAVRELVFAAGLSTRAEVGPVAGRGVGCDAVRREVERLGGHVAVASAPGRGTTFTIVLPLTLAIARALLVRVGGAGYAIPLAFTERIAEAGELPESASAGHRRVRVDGAWVPLRSLAEVLRLPPTAAAQVVLVLRVGESRAALTVDAVLGQEEIVVKRLEHVLAGHPLFSGMTIDADGAPVLILDAPGLVGHGGGRGEALPAPGAAATPARSADPAVAAVGPRVLFVDDSLSVRKVAEKFLGALGAQVTLANDGVDALAKLRQGAFDVVFTDLEMPRMHGYELLREVRFIPAFKDLPLIVVTSRSGQKHRAQAEALGANGYLTKPFTQDALQQMLALHAPALRAP